MIYSPYSSLAVFVVVGAFLANESHSFVTPSSTSSTRAVHSIGNAGVTATSSGLRMSSSASDEVAKLLEAAAKAREDAARLSKVRTKTTLFFNY